MSQWSTSYRWESRARVDVDKARGKGRDKRPAIGPMLSHALRSVERREGIEHVHSNERIDDARTDDNVVWLPDGAGGLRLAGPGDSIAAVEDWIDERVGLAVHTKTMKDGTVKPVAVRKDATVCLEVILQLDPEYTGKVVDMTAEQKADARAKLHAMVREVQRVTGPDNTAAVAEHWDEDHPHIHMFLVPLSEDSTLVGARIMGESKQAYAARHDEMRTVLLAEGYDATFERVDAGRGHEPVRVFKARRDREKAERELADRNAAEKARLHFDRQDLKAARKELAEAVRENAEHEDRVNRKGAVVDQREKEVSAAWGQINAKSAELDRDRVQLDVDQEAAAQALAEAKKAREAARASLARQQAAESALRARLAEEEEQARRDADDRVAEYERRQMAAVDERVGVEVARTVAPLRAEAEAAKKVGFEEGRELARTALKRKVDELQTRYEEKYYDLVEWQKNITALFKSTPRDKWSPGMQLGWKKFRTAEEARTHPTAVEALIRETPARSGMPARPSRDGPDF